MIEMFTESLLRVVKPLLESNALGFLREGDIAGKQRDLIDKRVREFASCGIGKRLGIHSGMDWRGVPLTTYSFYYPYFNQPSGGDLLYPLENYVRAHTSGTMGRPKSFLLPKKALQDNLQKTGLTFMLLCTHDGEKIRFEVGDVIYRNAPGGNFLSGFMHQEANSIASKWVKSVPSDELSFKDKVEYFIQHYKEVDVAYMNVPTLLEEVYPRIGEELHLKGFYTQDRSAAILKEEIKRVTGGYPKVIYGSTETMFSALPSIEHPGGFFFDWRVIYPEFIPEEKALTTDAGRIDEPPEMVSMTDVEVDHRYQLVATPLRNDLNRYVMPDIMECIDTGDSVLGSEAPVFTYYARCDRLVMLHNFTRISEEELIRVLKDSDIPLVEFTARREMEGTRDYMKIYLELSKHVEEDTVKERIEGQLLSFDKDWRDLKSYLRYDPLKVQILPRGSFSRYLDARGGLPKVERIEMRDENLNLLLESMQKKSRGRG
jgi:hypothetical protein